ncbi:MAG TPA: hypothetical protein VK196_16795 [Magnetospirillum sp.]|nr:hypothetical protein [Magnetospirillum sp.]
MSFRRTLSFAAVAAILAIGSAQAGQLDGQYVTPMKGGINPHVGGTTTNSLSANNIAAGFGNKANQSIYADQSGGYGKWPGVTTNSIDATNLAAGYGNKANQDIMARQSGGGVPTFNRLDALNMAVGEHNFANQRLMTQQQR